MDKVINKEFRERAKKLWKSIQNKTNEEISLKVPEIHKLLSNLAFKKPTDVGKL